MRLYSTVRSLGGLEAPEHADMPLEPHHLIFVLLRFYAFHSVLQPFLMFYAFHSACITTPSSSACRHSPIHPHDVIRSQIRHIQCSTVCRLVWCFIIPRHS